MTAPASNNYFFDLCQLEFFNELSYRPCFISWYDSNYAVDIRISLERLETVDKYRNTVEYVELLGTSESPALPGGYDNSVIAHWK